ncbi:hypothetical protein CNX65_15875 [Actinosynnema pretiosum]|uniref:3-oxoacyl-ACP synthase n=1 Tax=Actinosynnema pretiosum TaxID=42197 RepID=A0A290ZGS2_9PSEU|nr:hypothetical protein CNX65_15875 [Actinosynnema pretiosum]
MTDIHLDAIGARLGRPLDLADAVADGRYAEDEHTANGLLGVVVADDGQYAPDMAVEAVRAAMSHSSTTPEDIRLILHASVYFQGQDMWTPATYIQQRTIGGSAPSVDVDQKSNGGMAALALAAGYLSACDHDAAVLITTCDRFCLPGWDRFRSESGTVLGDGATATVLTRRPGFARLLSVAMTADPTLEEMYRGDGLRAEAAPTDRPLNLRSRKQRYMRKHLRELDAISRRIAGGVVTAMTTALDEAGVGLADVKRVVLPNIGKTVHWWTLLAELGVTEERTTWDFGRTIGHLGAGDQFAALHHLVRRGELEPGDRVLLAGSGHGFNWAGAVLEVSEAPDWGSED